MSPRQRRTAAWTLAVCRHSPVPRAAGSSSWRPCLFSNSLFSESLFSESLFGESLFGESLFGESLAWWQRNLASSRAVPTPVSQMPCSLLLVVLLLLLERRGRRRQGPWFRWPPCRLSGGTGVATRLVALAVVALPTPGDPPTPRRTALHPPAPPPPPPPPRPPPSPLAPLSTAQPGGSGTATARTLRAPCARTSTCSAA